jgi:hypothetical protein
VGFYDNIHIKKQPKNEIFVFHAAVGETPTAAFSLAGISPATFFTIMKSDESFLESF